MKSLTLITILIAMAVSCWLFGGNMPTQSSQPETTAKQEVKNSEPSRVFANMKYSVFKNKSTKPSDLDENNPAMTAKVNTKPVKQEPQLAAVVHDQLRVEDINDEAETDAVDASTPAELPENWDTMTQAALSEPDPELRSEAIHTLSLYHHKEKVSVLAEASTVDPDPLNRAKAVQALWIAAADNPDEMADIKSQLVKAGKDADPDVSTLAEKAIADLEKLAKARH